MTFTSSIPISSARVLVFSDFNCPYCFTLNEWIHTLGMSSRIRWVGVEHRPDLPLQGPNGDADRALLANEVRDVQSRAPEVGVRTPSGWLNSRISLMVQNAVEDDHPELAPQVRSKIFRRYWHDGDLAINEESLKEYLAALGVELPFLEPDVLDEWSKWWKVELDRIPVMIAPNGACHRGLQDFEAVRLFLNGGLHEGIEGPGCQ
jgi:predicted DsbA family dithiol-disulfide isomerase